jgi:DNA-binding GntR family transcriptional regulator
LSEALAPIEQSLLSDVVYDKLWAEIAGRRLLPGAKLSDVQLSRELGVSRTPVREALHKLARDGIVSSERRRGFSVTVFEPDDVRELHEIRLVLESAAVVLAAPRLGVEDLAEARAALEEAAQAVARDAPDARSHWLGVDREFHRLLARRTGNRRLEALIEEINSKIRVFQDYGSRIVSRLERATEEHREIIAALEAHSVEGAQEAMEDHIRANEQLVLAELARERSA